MAYYDTGAMRSCAGNIQSTLTSKYAPAKEAIDALVAQMSSYFTDDVSTQFANKYNNEAKVTAENLMKLMNQYVTLLNQTADQYDKVITTGLSGLGG